MPSLRRDDGHPIVARPAGNRSGQPYARLRRRNGGHKGTRGKCGRENRVPVSSLQTARAHARIHGRQERKMPQLRRSGADSCRGSQRVQDRTQAVWEDPIPLSGLSEDAAHASRCRGQENQMPKLQCRSEHPVVKPPEGPHRSGTEPCARAGRLHWPGALGRCARSCAAGRCARRDTAGQGARSCTLG